MKRICISLGDVNGVGPEITLRALYAASCPNEVGFVIIGDGVVLSRCAESLGVPVPPEWNPKTAGDCEPTERVVFYNPYEQAIELVPGQVRADAAKAAVCWIEEAVGLCMSGAAAAMVTAPICKEGLMAAGLKMPGHTEYLAELTGTKRFAMMLMGGALRVVLATRHVPLRCVADVLNVDEIVDAGLLLQQGLEWMGFSSPRVGVCGLNPHAGDGGALGYEERDVIGPAVRRLKKAGVAVTGPIPADTIFYQTLKGAYDGVLAMYHDQGLGPLKMLAFDTGINLTLGLPIIRTSPDHGTAFDIAGLNQANSASMEAAVALAVDLSTRENPWRAVAL